jgi:uncharacterized repeat protein (TIGR03803 family)
LSSPYSRRVGQRNPAIVANLKGKDGHDGISARSLVFLWQQVWFQAATAQEQGLSRTASPGTGITGRANAAHGTKAGSFDFTVRATDSSTGTGPYRATHSYRLTVNPPLAIVANFNVATSGAFPEGGMVEDKSGKFFGTTLIGGPADGGTLFEVKAGSSSIITLATFTGADGAYPSGSLIEDAGGNLFGTTQGGGANGLGVVFELAAGSGTNTTLASFDGTSGANPTCGLVEDGSGNLFGTTNNGGANGLGVVFEVAAGTGTITALASFDGTNGATPFAGLVADSSGNLFGTAFFGGANNDGTVFELQARSSTITPLASFDGANGANPYGGLLDDSGGNLFGTAQTGGATNNGTVFEVQAGSGTITHLASFNGPDGAQPLAGLIEDNSGNLFGTTQSGGTVNAGAVFEVKAGSGAITNRASFNFGGDGTAPSAGLIEDKSGNLFGITTQGGATHGGVIFELATVVLTPTSLPAATEGVVYSRTIAATGGIAPYTFAVTSGVLPAGLTLNSATGVLSGSPTVTGSFNFTITANETYGLTGSQANTVKIDFKPVALAGTVFMDHNEDGKQDDGEKGIPGVTVQLYSGSTLLLMPCSWCIGARR